MRFFLSTIAAAAGVSVGVEPGHEIDPCQADCPDLCYKSCHDKCDKGNIGTKDCEDCAKGKALRKAG